MAVIEKDLRNFIVSLFIHNFSNQNSKSKNWGENKMELPIIIASVPTLSEWGLIAMVGILAIVGILALRKRLSSQS